MLGFRISCARAHEPRDQSTQGEEQKEDEHSSHDIHASSEKSRALQCSIESKAASNARRPVQATAAYQLKQSFMDVTTLLLDASPQLMYLLAKEFDLTVLAPLSRGEEP